MAKKPTAWTEQRLFDASSRHARAVQSHKDEAARRFAALLQVEELVLQGRTLAAAREAVAAKSPKGKRERLSAKTLRRWSAMVANAPRNYWQALLLPNYEGGAPEAEVSTEAWDFFKADFLRLEQPSSAGCFRRLQRVAAIEGWTVPSLRTLERKMAREVSRPVLILAREGQDALFQTYPPQIRDRRGFAALEALNADGHRFDVFVRFPNGAVGRPLMVCVQDLYSGKLLGYRVGASETAELVRLAFHDVVIEYGIPQHVWLDNGRAFASKSITGGVPSRHRFKVKEDDPVGLLVGLGIEVHWATPHHGQAKPIERAFRDLCDSVSKHPAFAGAYTGNSPANKPANHGERAIPFDEFREVLRDEIFAHNAQAGRRSLTCNGRSFDETFNESYCSGPVRRATKEQRDVLLMQTVAIKANPKSGSIRIDGNYYWNEKLVQWGGTRVVVRFDPDNLHKPVTVYGEGNRLICVAEPSQLVGFSNRDAARKLAKDRREYLLSVERSKTLALRMTASEVAARLPRSAEAPELPTAKVIRPLFGVPSSPPFIEAETDKVAVNARALFHDTVKQLRQLITDRSLPDNTGDK